MQEKKIHARKKNPWKKKINARKKIHSRKKTFKNFIEKKTLKNKLLSLLSLFIASLGSPFQKMRNYLADNGMAFILYVC